MPRKFEGSVIEPSPPTKNKCQKRNNNDLTEAGDVRVASISEDDSI
jgi:hypothetical protein